MNVSNLQKQPKKRVELIISAILYEIIGSILVSITLKLIGGYGAIDTFFLSIVLSFIALFWNVIFNYFFDCYLIRRQGNIIKSMRDRIMHGIGFEAIFAIFALLFIMLYKQMGFIEALFMESFFLLFFLIYTIFYTYLYDMFRCFLLSRIRPHHSHNT